MNRISVDEITSGFMLYVMTTSSEPRRGRRPRAGEAADVRVMLRLTQNEFEALERAATLRDISVSEYVRDAALRAARRRS